MSTAIITIGMPKVTIVIVMKQFIEKVNWFVHIVGIIRMASII